MPYNKTNKALKAKEILIRKIKQGLNLLKAEYSKVLEEIRQLKGALKKAQGVDKDTLKKKEAELQAEVEKCASEISIFSKELKKLVVTSQIVILDADGTVIGLINDNTVTKYLQNTNISEEEKKTREDMILSLCIKCTKNESDAVNLFDTLSKSMISMAGSHALQCMEENCNPKTLEKTQEFIRLLSIFNSFVDNMNELNFDFLSEKSERQKKKYQDMKKAKDDLLGFYLEYYGTEDFYDFFVLAQKRDNDYYPRGKTLFEGLIENKSITSKGMLLWQKYSIFEFLMHVVSDRELLLAYLEKRNLYKKMRLQGVIPVIFTLGLCSHLYEKLFGVYTVDSIVINEIETGKPIDYTLSVLDKKSPAGFNKLVDLVVKKYALQSKNITASLIDDTPINCQVANAIQIDEDGPFVLWSDSISCNKITDPKQFYRGKQGDMAISNFCYHVSKNHRDCIKKMNTQGNSLA